MQPTTMTKDHHEPRTSASPEAPEAMRALLQTGYGAADVLKVGTIERPRPGVGEVIVEVRAAGLDRGTWHLMTGRPYLVRLMGYGFLAPKNPVPGIDLAGVVREVGPGVTRLRPGDEVFGIGQGTFAEYARAREEKLALKPACLSFEEAAVSGVSALTAFQALGAAGGVKAGERVLVIGASGGVGTFAVQLARALGAEVTAVASEGKLDLVRSLGASRAVDYRAEDFADGLTRYDRILDIGGNTPLARLRRALTPTGCLIFVGGEAGGDWTAGFGRQLWAMAIARFVRQRCVMLMADESGEDLERLAELASRGAFRPVIDRRVGLAEVAPAMRDLEAGRVRGKVVVTPS